MRIGSPSMWRRVSQRGSVPNPFGKEHHQKSKHFFPQAPTFQSEAHTFMSRHQMNEKKFNVIMDAFEAQPESQALVSNTQHSKGTVAGMIADNLVKKANVPYRDAHAFAAWIMLAHKLPRQ